MRREKNGDHGDSKSPKKAFPHLKGRLTLLENMRMKLFFPKKVSKVVHFTDLFLRVCSLYSHFEFKLKIIIPYLQ